MARMEDEQKAPVKTYDLNGKWTLSFVDEAPSVGKTYQLDKLQTW
jgi:hypothetical protein